MVGRWRARLLVGVLALSGMGCTMDVSVKDLNPAAGGISVSINEVTVVEGQTGMMTVTLSAPAPSDFLITYYTQDDSATSSAPQDFTAQLGVLTVPQGQAVVTLPVTSIDDAWY